MTKRAERITIAFINCVKNGEFDYNYAVTLLEDNSKYGFLTDGDKEVFYNAFEATEELVAEEPIIEEPIIEEPIIEEPIEESIEE